MSRSPNLKDYGIDEETNPVQKFNSLISVTVSTVMCLAAKCPIPKPNVETTKLFLRTVTDDKGKPPRNIKGLLTLLNHYSGPYEADSIKKKCLEDSGVEELKVVEAKPLEEADELPELLRNLELVKETSPAPDSQSSAKRYGKVSVKKSEKDSHKKGNKNLGLRISSSKSTINYKI